MTLKNSQTVRGSPPSTWEDFDHLPPAIKRALWAAVYPWNAASLQRRVYDSEIFLRSSKRAASRASLAVAADLDLSDLDDDAPTLAEGEVLDQIATANRSHCEGKYAQIALCDGTVSSYVTCGVEPLGWRPVSRKRVLGEPRKR